VDTELAGPAGFGPEARAFPVVTTGPAVPRQQYPASRSLPARLISLIVVASLVAVGAAITAVLVIRGGDGFAGTWSFGGETYVVIDRDNQVWYVSPGFTKGAFEGEFADGAISFYNPEAGGMYTLRHADGGRLTESVSWDSGTADDTTLMRYSDETDYRVIEQKVQGSSY